MAEPLRREEAEPSCILLLRCGRREHSGDWCGGLGMDAECKETKGARGGLRSAAVGLADFEPLHVEPTSAGARWQ